MFKNAIPYLVTPGFRLDPELLSRRMARPCGPSEGRTGGFATPCDHSTAELAHHVAGYTLICLETEDRLLPGSVVAEEVELRAIDLEKAQGYKPGRKQLRELKERVTLELLPKAFTQKRRTLGVFAGQYFIVDTSSPARADMMIDALRSVLDALPLTLIQTLTAIAELKAKVGAGKTATVTKEMIGAAHDVMLKKGDFVLSANLLERIFLAMEQAAPPQTPFDTCPTCEALARTVMMDQTGAA